MTTLTRIKLALVVMGLIVFGYGVRNESSRHRWVAVGVLAVALLLRFARREAPSEPPHDTDE